MTAIKEKFRDQLGNTFASSSTPIELIPIEYQVFVTIQTENDDDSTTTLPVLIRLESSSL